MNNEIIDILCVPFGEYINGKADENTLTKAVQFWYFSLPKYTKVMSNRYIGSGKYSSLDRCILRLKDCLRSPELGASNFLLERLPKILDEKDSSQLADHLIQAKCEIDNILPAMLDALMLDICEIFCCNDKAALWDALTGWYDRLPEYTKLHCFECGEDRLLHAITKGSNNISNLCYVMIGLEPEYFEEKTPAELIAKIFKYKTVVENYSIRQKNEEDTYSILLNGHTVKTFGKTTSVSNTGRLMQNELAAIVTEYGQAVGLNEKRQILLNVLDGIGNVVIKEVHHGLHG